MLSDRDIVKELGKNINIYPFDARCLKGASINLTASKMAWSITTKENVTKDNQIIIHANDTTLIYTNEIVVISNKLGGTFHSRVNDVSIGCGHIGTTLNPGWFGRLLIAITNHTKKDVTIKVNDDFVTLVLEYLNNKSSNDEDDNVKSRRDILDKIGIRLTDEERDILDNQDIQTRKKMLSVVNEKKTYNEIKNSKKIQTSRLFLASVVCLIILVICFFVFSPKTDSIFYSLSIAAATFLTTYILSNIFKK